MSVARIETDRLLLRPWREEDAGALSEALNESVDHLLPWIPWAKAEVTTLDDARARAMEWAASFASGTEYVYALFDHAEKRLVGGAGLYPRVGPGGIEIGYWIRLAEAGRGYATDATRALTEVGLAMPGIERLEIRCDPANLSSRRVPEKLGYRLIETIRGAPGPGGVLRDTVVYEFRAGQGGA